MLIRLLALTLGVAAAAPALADPVTAADVTPIVERADRDERDTALDASRQPARAIAFMQVEPGDRVLDMFAAGGYFTELLARAVGPDGSVIAHNPASFTSRAGLEAAGVQRGYGAERLPNVRELYADFADLALAPDSVDNVLFHLVYHDIYVTSEEFGLVHADPQDVLAAINTGLTAGGTVTVIDHVGAPGGDVRQIAHDIHRIDPAVVIEDFRKAGFALVAQEIFHENPADDPDLFVFDPSVRGQTNRFAMRFARAGDPNVRAAAMTEKPDDAVGSPSGTDDVCGAEAVQDWLGRSYGDETSDALAEGSGAKTVRVYETGDPVTMDYRPDRLNVELEPTTGTIVALSCG
jgi:predicted methyltransferase